MNEHARDPSVDAVLARLCRRQRLRNAVRWLGHGLLAGTAVAVGAGVVGLVIDAAWLETAWWAPLAWIAATAAAASAVGAALPVDRLLVARALDRAASSQDRFASAMELAGDRRRARAQLVIDDALRSVERTTPRAALPLRRPPGLPWTTLALLGLAAILIVGPGAPIEATPPAAPTLSPEQWRGIHERFERQLEELPEPRTEPQREVDRMLRELADMLGREPTIREVMAELARLRSGVSRHSRSNPTSETSMRRAGRSLRSSTSLQEFATSLRRGDYRDAARSLEKLADGLQADELSMTASEFERAADDLESMAGRLDASPQLEQACRQCAGAAGSMNRNQFADSLRRFADQLRRNADDLENGDRFRQANRMLDELARDLNRQKRSCPSCKNGTCSSCQGQGCASCSGSGQCSACQGGRGGAWSFVSQGNGAGKGGLRAGWGSAERWHDGGLSPEAGIRVPDVVSVHEGDGRTTSFTVVSGDEAADAAQALRELYVDLVRKSEADLELKGVPVAYREYLRRYFSAIRPIAAEEHEGHDAGGDGPAEGGRP